MSVPPVAATWIATVLKEGQLDQQCLKARLINPALAHTGQLERFTTKELRLICSCIEQCGFNWKLESDKIMRSYKGGRKPDLARKIRNALYTDFPTCQLENRAAMMELETLTRRHPHYTPAMAPAATPSPQAPAALPPSQPAPAAAAFPPTSSTATAASVGATLLTNSTSSNNNQKRNHAQAFAQNFGPALLFTLGLPPQNGLAQSNNYSNTAANPVVGGSGVNDATKDPETTPQNGHEALALHQLRHMGFQVDDTREILTAYRKLGAERASAPTPDEVLMYVVEQRDRLEEERFLAADMDRARLESERSRDDAAQRRAEIQQERERQLENASLESWMSDAFVKSWILHCDPTWRDGTVQPWIREGDPTPLKRKLLKLLQMESNARKWYQEKLPGAYFVHVVLDRLRKASQSQAAMLTQLEKEIQILERGMYELERQVGGVPIIFREALDANPSADENQDEEVVLVVHKNRMAHDGASPSPKKQSTKKKNRSTADACRV